MSYALNGSAQTIPGGVRLTTDGVFDQAGSFFLTTKQAYANFVIDFDYLATSLSEFPADGFTITLQNDPRGTTALGFSGRDLAYADVDTLTLQITPSISFQTNIFLTGIGLGGVSYGTDGALTPKVLPGTIALVGTPIHYHIEYDGTTLSTTMTQGLSNFNLSQVVDLTTVLGGSGLAYVGFTGSTGSFTSTQDITNFTFVSRVACLHKNTLVTVLNSKQEKINKAIEDVRAGDRLINHKGKAVEVLHNVRFCKSDSFVKIQKGSLSCNLPTEDLLIVAKHPIIVNHKVIMPSSLLKTKGVNRVKVEPAPVYSICTKEKTWVIMQGIPVCTWAYSDLMKAKYYYELI